MLPDALDFITSSPFITATVVVGAISLSVAVHAMFDA
jgi:hypothetical protein